MTGVPKPQPPISATHLTPRTFPASTLQEVGRAVSTTLAMLRPGPPPNIGQARPATSAGRVPGSGAPRATPAVMAAATSPPRQALYVDLMVLTLIQPSPGRYRSRARAYR